MRLTQDRVRQTRIYEKVVEEIKDDANLC